MSTRWSAATIVATRASLLVSLVAAACAPADGSPASTPAPSGTAVTAPAGTAGAAATTDAADRPTPTSDPRDATSDPRGPALEWAFAYTGGPGGVAVGAPIRIGYVNEEDRFPGSTRGLDAALVLVNERLGGIAGRPIEVARCPISSPADATRCAAEFVADPTMISVLSGALTIGNRELHRGLDGALPLIIGTALTTDDLTTGVGRTLLAPPAALLVGIGALVAGELSRTAPIDEVAVLVPDSAGGRSTVDLLLRPVLDDAGIRTTVLPVGDAVDAGTVRVAREAGADVFVPLLDGAGCVAVHDALDALDALDELDEPVAGPGGPVVVATLRCLGEPLATHLATQGVDGAVPDGWYVVATGPNPYLPELDGGLRTWSDAMVAADPARPWDPTDVDAAGSFAGLLTLVRLMNELGPDRLSPSALDTAIDAFRGPMMLQTGTLACGDRTLLGLSLFRALCATEVGVHRYVDGRWESSRIETADVLDRLP